MDIHGHTVLSEDYKLWLSQKYCCIVLKDLQNGNSSKFFEHLPLGKTALSNSADPDQTAHIGAVRSGSSLVAGMASFCD